MIHAELSKLVRRQLGGKDIQDWTSKPAEILGDNVAPFLVPSKKKQAVSNTHMWMWEKNKQTNSILTVTLLFLGDFLEVNTRSSACGLGQLSHISDSDRKKLKRWLRRSQAFRRSKHKKGVRRRHSGTRSGVEASAPSVWTEHYFWASSEQDRRFSVVLFVLLGRADICGVFCGFFLNTLVVQIQNNVDLQDKQTTKKKPLKGV